MKKKGKYERIAPRKRMRWWKILMIILAVLLVLVGSVLGFGMSYLKGLIGEVRQATYEEKELTDEELEAILGYVPEDESISATESQSANANADKPVDESISATESQPANANADKPVDEVYGEMGKIINVMLIGQQYREGEESKLSDTMILCTINRETNTLTMTSFLRDTYVQLPNYKGKVCGMQRMNVCYNLGWNWGGDLGGMEMLDMLLLNNFGVEVDYNVEINFSTMKKLINLMGGVTINLTEDEARYMTEYEYLDGTFSAGETVLNGNEALFYARIRKSSATDNDFYRTARQRYLITQIIKQCMTMSFKDLNNLIQEAIPMILTDMTDDEILELAKIAIGMLSDLKIESNQCPAEGTYSGKIVQIYGQDAGVLVPNLQKNQTILKAITEDGKSVEEALALIEE